MTENGSVAETGRGDARPIGWGVESGENTRPDPYEVSLGERTATSSPHERPPKSNRKKGSKEITFRAGPGDQSVCPNHRKRKVGPVVHLFQRAVRPTWVKALGKKVGGEVYPKSPPSIKALVF